MVSLPKNTTPDDARELLARAASELGADEFAVVANPSYIYAPFELYPLPPRVQAPIPRIAGIVKDMDGTTTTTEPLCLHSLEWMVGRVTGRTIPSEWEGLDRARDYPHIIGNSTTKHVEYLVETYADAFDERACLEAWIEAAVWTLAHGRDPGRRREVGASMKALGLSDLAGDAEFSDLVGAERYDEEATRRFAKRAAGERLERFRIDSLTQRVRAAVDIYYMRYHVILSDIADGHGEERARQVLGSESAHLIEPMPAIGVLLAAVKGMLGRDLSRFGDMLVESLRKRLPDAPLADVDRGVAQLGALGETLASAPVPVAVVTSSIAWEAGIVLGEVFRVLRGEVADWPVDDATKERAIVAFADPQTFYDAVVTASDSSEIRLKPHRDLYSIALHAMGLGPEDFPCVIGFEDSESGVTAIRAAGVGLSVAVPFADTAGHDLSLAAEILHGQMPEAILLRGLFLGL